MGSLKPFVALQHPDSLINRIENNIATALGPVTSILFLDGRSISNLSIVSGVPLNVDHGLNRPVSEWWVTSLDANTVIWSSTSPDPNTILVLNSSANANISIWVS